MTGGLPRRERIPTLDILRGYFILVVLIDHLGFFPSLFELGTGRGTLWASAAEGFFIISGVIVGYVYGPILSRSLAAAFKKMWRRAAQLYVLSLALTYLFVFWGHFVPQDRIKEGLWQYPPIGEFIYKTLTLQYYYGWADFLPYYAVFMLFAPLVVYLCYKRLAWLVPPLTVAIWLARQNSFYPAWQILFMNSIVFGYYLPEIERWVRGKSDVIKRRVKVALYTAAIVTVAFSALMVNVSFSLLYYDFDRFLTLPVWLQQLIFHLDGFHELTRPWDVKWTLEPLRFSMAVLWFGALYVLVRGHEQAISRLTRGFFTTLGRSSLFAYNLQAVTVFAVLLLVSNTVNFVLNTLMTLAVVAVFYVVVLYWHRAIVARRRQRRA